MCANTPFSLLTMHWIMAKSIDEPKTSRSIMVRTDFPGYDMLDAMIASAWKKLLTHVHFRKSKCRRATLIYEHFRATGASEAVQGLSDLFNIRLQNDDVEDFDTRWDQALLAASETPTEMVLEGSYKSKLQDCGQVLTVLALYEQENIRNNEQRNCSRLKTSVRRHIDQTMRKRNFRARNDMVERGAVTKSQKREKSKRGKEGGRLQSVESHWTVFERRLM